MLSPYRLTCEYRQNPLGLGVRQPRLSWQLRADDGARGAAQSAYQLVVAADLSCERSVLWDTGKVHSDQSVHVRYEGPPLRSTQRCYWRVRVWDEAGRPSDWSEIAWWEMGLLTVDDWQAEWITPDWDDAEDEARPAPFLRYTFTVDGEVRAARLYATSLGLYELYLNGQRVGDAVLTPGWTSYRKRLQYPDLRCHRARARRRERHRRDLGRWLVSRSPRFLWPATQSLRRPPGAAGPAPR